MSPSPTNDGALPYEVSVLVVDDEVAHAEAVAEALDRAGCRCRTAASGNALRSYPKH